MFNSEPEFEKREAVVRYAIGGVLALLAPFLIIAAIISLPDRHSLVVFIPWYGWLLGLLLIGIVGIHLLPVKQWTKAAMTACYVPGGAFVFAGFFLSYACAFYGDCL
ncbi:hypothetical protein QWY75_10045 [Pontixanthobacter aestiaquae]|uniref:Uncharacterized protein n=1 Tax=Pontixanthobacter aestiaquae TaxID=1509367 RepID=A0A844Z4P5_9SPHN|nr:hypothetical protein [Pontixanthobacter aestiaquae]MDN3646538.1 hypothetical protein [Pontixanthobacter aestiaquae]MXO82474.1 hypothetical protein [Pontixanthobacter aestiaquae]